MSGFRLFCFKQFFKVHIFCLAMMVIFRLFMNVNLGFTLWIALVISALSSCGYLLLKPFMITRDIYTIMAITSCISLSIIAGHFLWIALSIDWGNLMFFLAAMIVFAVIVLVSSKILRKRKNKKRTKTDYFIYLRIVSWGFLGFLFFYQVILSFLLRPNFLTVMALAISHFNLLLIIWTYFDLGRMYDSSKTRKVVVKLKHDPDCTSRKVN